MRVNTDVYITVFVYFDYRRAKQWRLEYSFNRISQTQEEIHSAKYIEYNEWMLIKLEAMEQ